MSPGGGRAADPDDAQRGGERAPAGRRRSRASRWPARPAPRRTRPGKAPHAWFIGFAAAGRPAGRGRGDPRERRRLRQRDDRRRGGRADREGRHGGRPRRREAGEVDSLAQDTLLGDRYRLDRPDRGRRHGRGLARRGRRAGPDGRGEGAQERVHLGPDVPGAVPDRGPDHRLALATRASRTSSTTARWPAARGPAIPVAYLVMEYVDGEPLSAQLARDGRLPAARVLEIVRQAALALAEAHRVGMVHRDVKPGNLLVRRSDGAVKITDFGIARAADAVPLTQNGMVVGTAQYFSPEQAEGRVVGPASDVYSLGVVAYECLAGRLPFVADSPVAVAMMQIRDAPPPLPAGRAGAGALAGAADAGQGPAAAVRHRRRAGRGGAGGAGGPVRAAGAGAGGVAGRDGRDQPGAAVPAAVGGGAGPRPGPAPAPSPPGLPAGAAAVGPGAGPAGGSAPWSPAAGRPSGRATAAAGHRRVGRRRVGRRRPTSHRPAACRRRAATTGPASRPGLAPPAVGRRRRRPAGHCGSPAPCCSLLAVAGVVTVLLDSGTDGDGSPVALGRQPPAEQPHGTRGVPSTTTEGSMTTPRLLGSRYEIGETLGYGGMAEVHRGRDVRLGREVAVKVLRADLARDPSFQARFRREAQAAASLNHPAIVAVYDTGEEDMYGNQPYIVMEYVEGRTLRDVLKTEGRLMPRRAMEIVADVCAALDFSPPQRDRAPGRQARQRDDHPQRRGQGDGLRHRPRGRRQRRHRDPDRRGDRHRAVPVAGAGPRRERRRPLGRLLHRRAALRADHRAARRSPATPRSRWRTSTCGRTRRRRPRSTRTCRRSWTRSC